MIDCLILGDQVADGLRDYITGCVPLTYQDITSSDYEAVYGYSTLITENGWRTVIISLGINDNPDGLHTKRRLRDLRSRIQADHVFWILPPESVMQLRIAVHDVAMGRQDGLLETAGWNRDLLPTSSGYREIAAKLNK